MIKLIFLSAVIIATVAFTTAQGQCAKIFKNGIVGNWNNSSLSEDAKKMKLLEEFMQCSELVEPTFSVCEEICQVITAGCIVACAPEAETCGPACIAADAACIAACKRNAT